MLFARQAEDPVRIVQASFGADNVLLDARLENKSTIRYRPTAWAGQPLRKKMSGSARANW